MSDINHAAAGAELPPARHKARDFEGWAEVYTSHEVKRIVEQAIAADRAQREDAHTAEMAQWARDHGLNVPPQWEAAPASAQPAEQGGDYSDPTLVCTGCGLTMGESRTLGHLKLGLISLAASPATVTEPAAPADEQQRACKENADFTEWWNRVQACPEHNLITENAAHAAWQERARRAAPATAGMVVGNPPEYDAKHAETRMDAGFDAGGHTAGMVGAADPVVEANRQLLLDRSRVGIHKYGVTLANAGLSRRQLTQHALEEALDLANYLQTIIQNDADAGTVGKDAKDAALEYRTCCDHPDCSTCAGRGGFYRMAAQQAQASAKDEGGAA